MIAEATVYKLFSSDDRLNALMDKIRGGAFGNGFKQGIFTYAIPENPVNVIKKELAPFGITPARAGKTSFLKTLSTPPWDHPRACG